MTVDVSALVGADPDQNETVLAILDAATECMARFGNSKTSMQDVAEAASVSRSTLYRYFPDRTRLFEAVTEYFERRQAAWVSEHVQDDTKFEQLLAIVVESVAADNLRFQTSGHLRAHDRGLAHYLSFNMVPRAQSLDALLRPYIERSAARGELASTVSVDEAIEWISTSLLVLPALPPMKFFDGQDPAGIGRAYAARLSYGLAAPAPKGRTAQRSRP